MHKCRVLWTSRIGCAALAKCHANTRTLTHSLSLAHKTENKTKNSYSACDWYVHGCGTTITIYTRTYRTHSHTSVCTELHAESRALKAKLQLSAYRKLNILWRTVTGRMPTSRTHNSLTRSLRSPLYVCYCTCTHFNSHAPAEMPLTK